VLQTRYTVLLESNSSLNHLKILLENFMNFVCMNFNIGTRTNPITTLYDNLAAVSSDLGHSEIVKKLQNSTMRFLLNCVFHLLC